MTVRTPMGRAGDFGNAATLWLLSEEVRYMARAILDVSGDFITP